MKLSGSALRFGLIALAILVGLFSVLDYLRWRSVQDRLAAVLSESGLEERRPDLAKELRREPDQAEARVQVAWELLSDELDRRWLIDLPAPDRARERERGMQRLETARELAIEASEMRVGSWSAAVVVGGATYLRMLRSKEPGLMATGPNWEAALQVARDWGPGRPEPLRFLAAAYLSHWTTLPQTKRDEATRLLADAFKDPKSFGLFVQSWLRVAPSTDLALSLVPEQAAAWLRLAQHFSRQRDWERYRDTRGRWRELQLDELARELVETERVLEGGDTRGARSRYLSLAARAEVDKANSPILRTILERLPPGPVSSLHSDSFRVWLDWSLDLCLIDKCPFPPQQMDRLALSSGVTEPHRLALAAVAADNVARGELYERRAARTASDLDEDWKAYYLLKGRRLMEHGDHVGAELALEKARDRRRDSALFWRARLSLGELMHDGSMVREATERLADLERNPVSATRWRWSAEVARVEFLAPTGTRSLLIELAEVPSSGAAVELLWNGEPAGVYSVRPGDNLSLSRPMDRGPHLLRLVSLERQIVRPGRISFFGADDSR